MSTATFLLPTSHHNCENAEGLEEARVELDLLLINGQGGSGKYR
jgi:hypothetical protein